MNITFGYALVRPEFVGSIIGERPPGPLQEAADRFIWEPTLDVLRSLRNGLIIGAVVLAFLLNPKAFVIGFVSGFAVTHVILSR